MKKFYKINEDGTVARGSGTVVPEEFSTDFSLIQLDENGNFYDFYNQDGTPDLGRCNEKAMLELIALGEQLTKNHIQSIIDKYNEDHSVKFENVDSCYKYTSDDTYSNYQFCVDIIAFNIKVWEACRTIQDDIINGNIEIPTEEEFIAMLPIYEGTV